MLSEAVLSMTHAAEHQAPLVLVVDDEPIIAATAVEILRISGYRATCVHDGKAALEAARQAVPDVLLSDVLMPGMNGFELAKVIKRTYPVCKILLFSGNATTTQELAATGAPEQEFEVVSKPLHPADLLRLIEKALQ
jgi:CheY-like chemotaxis protein